MDRLVSIDARYCGPDHRGNGGYTCGLLARAARRRVQVTLRRPSPLGRWCSHAVQRVRHVGDRLAACEEARTTTGVMPPDPHARLAGVALAFDEPVAEAG